MDRAIEALRVCAGKLQAAAASRGARLIATEACRAAENGERFLARVRAGNRARARDRRPRAPRRRSPRAGCASLLDPAAEGAILFDIGGGSSELVWLGRASAVDRGPPSASVRDWISLPLGVVTLAERHGGEQVSAETFDAMVGEVEPHDRRRSPPRTAEPTAGTASICSAPPAR